MKKNKKLGIIENVSITDIADEGVAVGRHNNMVVFVKNAVPGDVVNVQLTRSKSNYREGYALEVIESSQYRTDPFCTHFGTCGGCKWQHLKYETQLFFKQQQVSNQLKRIGGLDLPESAPIIGSEKNTFYRNKLEFTFSDRKWFEQNDPIMEQGDKAAYALGFHVPALFDKVVDVKFCHLQPEPSNQIRNFIRDYALSNNLSFFSIRKQCGFLRNLIVRNTLDGQVMVLLSVAENKPDEINLLLTEIKNKFPQVTSLYYAFNPSSNDNLLNIEVQHFAGERNIVETMGGLKFVVGPKSFFQTNSSQAFVLYSKILEFTEAHSTDVIYDLYTGTGTIANFIAPHCKKVIGVESVEEAIDDAKINSQINGIENTIFFVGDAKDVLTPSFVLEHGYPDVIIVDPPRAGLHPQVVEILLKLMPRKIVYVSCNASTQARDIKMLHDFYEVKKLQAVDMFPHTHHVESLAMLEQRSL